MYSVFKFKSAASKVPAFLNIVDIAGLVKGAHEGQGLGNAFLSHIRGVDAIFHLCRKLSRPQLSGCKSFFIVISIDRHI